VARGLSALGSDVLALHVVAREELDPPRRVARAIDPEDRTVARPLDDDTRDVYRARFAAWRDDVARAWRQAGIAWTMVSTADDAVRAVRRIVGAPAGASAGVSAMTT
jgi:hypothetical protein